MPDERPGVSQALYAHPSKIKVLYMSGYTDHAIVHRGFLEEGVDYVQKPLRSTD